MLRPPRSHQQYLEFFQTRRQQLEVKVPHDATDLWCKFRRTDLSAAHPILARLYDPTHGSPARPPVDMLRSWLLMLECHIPSVEVWVDRLHEQPFYALLSGFDPDKVPGVGTFYDFQDRVLQLGSPVLNQECRPRRRSEQRKKDGALRDKNDTAPHADILNRLADRLLARPATPAPYGAWQANPSARSGQVLAALPTYQRVLKEIFYTRVYAQLADAGNLPPLGLCVDKSADHPHDGSVYRMGTTKAGSENRPVFRPADTVFYTHADRTQLVIERFLLDGQFAAPWFLERRSDG